MAFRGEFSGRMGGFDVSPFQPHLVTWLIRCEHLQSPVWKYDYRRVERIQTIMSMHAGEQEEYEP
jgi:hypothetical protein